MALKDWKMVGMIRGGDESYERKDRKGWVKVKKLKKGFVVVGSGTNTGIFYKKKSTAKRIARSYMKRR